MNSQIVTTEQVDVTKGYYAMITFFGQAYTLRFKDSNGTAIDPNRGRMLERAESISRPWPWFSSPIIESVFIEADGTIRSKPMTGKAVVRTKAPCWDPDDFQWVKLK